MTDRAEYVPATVDGNASHEDETCCGLGRGEWGWLLFGAGLTGAVSLLLRRDRWLSDWLVPLGLAGAGATLLFKERDEDVSRAEQRVVTELEALDAIARAQVIPRIAARELGLRHSDSDE